MLVFIDFLRKASYWGAYSCFTCKQGINQMQFEGKISSLRNTLLFAVLHKFNEIYLWE